MATFEKDDKGNFTLKFNQNELKFVDRVKNSESLSTPDINGFVQAISHMLKGKSSNYDLLYDYEALYKELGLKKFRIKFSNWADCEVYASSKESAIASFPTRTVTSCREVKK